MAGEPKTNGKIKFQTTIIQSKKTATGIKIPEEIVKQLASGKRPPVKVTINGYTYRSSIAVMGGAYMLGVSAVVREKAGVSGGDAVDVELQLDTQTREVVLPPDFQKVLDSDTRAKSFFEGLSFSKKQFYVLPIDQAKTDETRRKRIEKALNLLKEGKT